MLNKKYLIIYSFIFVFSLIAGSFIFNSNKYRKLKKNNDYSLGYNDVRSLIYPVGSIYMSVSDDTVAKVQARFGGTWEVFGAGKTLVVVDSSNASFDTVEESGGSLNAALTVDNTPSHTHSITSTGSVSSSFTGSSTNTDTIGSHSHTLTAKGSISSSFTGTSTNTSTASLSGMMILHGTGYANIMHGIDGIFSGDGGSTSAYRSPAFNISETTGARSYGKITVNASHTHTVTAKGTVSSSFAGTLVNTSSIGDHSHTVTPKGTVSSTFTGSSTNTSAIGSGSSFSIVQPYVTVYMYKRTA